MEVFYKKNDIGVDIEYAVIGRYIDDGIRYLIYTDFVDDANSPSGIRLFVTIDNPEREEVPEEKRNDIIKKVHDLISSFRIDSIDFEQEGYDG